MKNKPKNQAAAAMGSRRMAKLTKAQRKALGRKAANARWRKHAARVSQKGSEQQ